MDANTTPGLLFSLDPQPTDTVVAAPNNGTVDLVFGIWRHFAPRSVQAILSPKRRRLIEKALHQYDLQTVLDAVIGWRYSAHHRGENPQRRVYNSIDLLLRDNQNIERFADYTRSAKVSAPLSIPATPDMHPVQSKRIGVFDESGTW